MWRETVTVLNAAVIGGGDGKRSYDGKGSYGKPGDVELRSAHVRKGCGVLQESA